MFPVLEEVKNSVNFYVISSSQNTITNYVNTWSCH
jgi:hypothetical protein